MGSTIYNCEYCSENYYYMEEMIYLDGNYNEIHNESQIEDGNYNLELCYQCAESIEEHAKPIIKAYQEGDGITKEKLFLSLIRNYIIKNNKVSRIERELRVRGINIK